MANQLPVYINERELIWEANDHTRALKTFLKSFNTQYFEYLLYIHVKNFDNPDTQHAAATAVRQLYYQVLETTLAVLCGILQGAGGLPAFMLHYKNNDLRTAVTAISNNQQLKGMTHPFDPVLFAEELMRMATDKNGELISQETAAVYSANLAETLGYLMKDFLTTSLEDEYNSIKHGLRVSSGPTQLKLKTEEMTDWFVLEAPHSSRFPMSVKIDGDKKRFRIQYQMLGFQPQQIALRTEIAVQLLKTLFASLHTLATGEATKQFCFVALRETIDEAWRIAPIGLTLTEMTDDWE